MLPSSADCQEDKVLIERDVLIRIASQLDSFEVLKKLEIEYLSFKDSCVILTNTQMEYIETQDKLIFNKSKQIENLKTLETEYKNLIEVNEGLVKTYQKKAKVGRRNTVISLVGGGVLTLGLTTALIISIVQ
jgi:hypothetical protein